nr:hypothetical protein [Tanacetum cinerariifolium]
MHSIGKIVNDLHAMLKLHEQTLPKKDVAPALYAIRVGRTQKNNNKNKKPQNAAKGTNQGYMKSKLAYALKPNIPPQPKKDNPTKDVICVSNVVNSGLTYPSKNDEGVDSVLRDGPWMIHGIPIFLKRWSPFVSLLKEELLCVLVWMKFYDVLLVAYTSDGLSFILTKIGSPVMLGSYMKSMCLESWGQSNYARVLIEINARNYFSDNLVPARGSTCLIYGYSLVDCPKAASKRVVNGMDKGKGQTSGADDERFIEVKKKNYVKSTYEASHKIAPSIGKNNVSTSGNGTFFLSNSFEALNVENPVIKEVETGNKAFTSGVQEEGQRSTPLLERINVFEKQLLEEKCVFVDDDGKPLKKVDYSGDRGSDDEVESIDNEMTSYLSSKPSGVGYDTKSLLEK